MRKTRIFLAIASIAMAAPASALTYVNQIAISGSATDFGLNFDYNNGAFSNLSLNETTILRDGSGNPQPRQFRQPSIWAMMIGGFGAVGSAMRYRRRRTK